MKRIWLPRIGFALIAVLIAVSIVLPDPSFHAQASDEEQTVSPGGQVLQIEYQGQAELQQLVANLDVWEVHPEAGYVVALVELSQFSLLDQAGYRYQPDARFLSHPDTIPGYACYRTIAELYTDLQQIANAHPTLTRLSTIGYSYENRPIKLLRLTNFANPGPKPVFFLMANIHGRELITPETAMVFIDYLLEHYGSDPDVTWVLDHHEVHVLVSANPDGHVKNEPGEPWSWWRKNTNPTNGCTSGKYGVDLNRNHTYAWGCCSGSSGNPCDETYRGPSAGSEGETQIIENYVRSVFPDQRGPGDDAAAPEDATGVLITLHSYSNLVLWPWGHTTTPAPNAAGLEALGRKMASYNLYAPGPSYSLYPTDGTTDEFSYGELGIASYTFEIGSYSDNFYPECTRYDALIQPNIQALFYAAKVARTPYLTARGPDALSLATVPAQVISGQVIELTATIDDGKNGSNPVAAAEYYLDTPPWAGGVAHPMSAVDGFFSAPVEAVSAQVSTAGLADGRHTIFVRGQDQGGYWGPPTAIYIDVQADSWITGQTERLVDGVAISGAQIAFTSPDYAYTAVSAPDGFYIAPVLSGTYTVTASAFGYAPQVINDITATTGYTTSLDFALQTLPAGTLAGYLKELGTNLPLSGQLLVQPSGQMMTVSDGSFELDLPQGIYTLTASAAGHLTRTLTDVSISGGQRSVVELYLPTPACVLLVNDAYVNSSTPEYEDYYRTALVQEHLQFEQWRVFSAGTPPLDVLNQYAAVLWYTGDVRYGTLNFSEQSLLRNYLQGGGALLLSGQNIAEDIAADSGDFLGTVLHTSLVSVDTQQTSLVGDGPYSGVVAMLNGGDGAGNQASPDVVALSGPQAGRAFNYGDNTLAGVAADTDTYRSLLLAFGVEGLQSYTQRAAVLQTGLDWLGCSPAGIDLRISQQVSRRFALPGQLLNYTITLHNYSPVPLTGLRLVDQLPPELTLVSTLPAAQVNGTQLTWQNLTIDPEGSLSFQINARIRTEVPIGSFISNVDYSLTADQFDLPQTGPGAGTFVSEYLPNQIYVPIKR